MRFEARVASGNRDDSRGGSQIGARVLAGPSIELEPLGLISELNFKTWPCARWTTQNSFERTIEINGSSDTRLR